jgi:UDP-N-acetylmuramate dehydrogenase
MKVGGELDVLTLRNREQVTELGSVRQERRLIVGGGSNLILPDTPFEGVVILPRIMGMEVLGTASQASTQHAVPRYMRTEESRYLNLEKVSIDETSGERVLVRFGAGVAWGAAVAQSLQRGLIGLHYFARIPCTVGGALVNNIHAGERLLDRYIHSAEVYNFETGECYELLHDELQFGYDTSLMHTQRSLMVVSVTMNLIAAEPDVVAEAQAAYQRWTAEKARVQPSGPNSGSTFQNLDPSLVAAQGLPHAAAGWYVEHAGLFGYQRGGMQVYTTHGNFIVNTGDGTQSDWIELVTDIRNRVHEAYGVWLLPEVEVIHHNGSRLHWHDNQQQWQES